MLLTVGEFRNYVQNKLPDLISKLQQQTRRYSSEEAKAWELSLPNVARAFEAPSMQPLHLYFGERGRLALEYRLPGSSSWCDMVLLGKHCGKPSGVVVELKHWTTRGDQPANVEGLMIRQGRSDLHPSDQVRGYTEYCRRFHSTVLEQQAAMYGCVMFTKDYNCDSYREAPNNKLAYDYPCFTLSPKDISENIPAYFAERLSESDEQFALQFENGYYQQDRDFCKQVAQQIQNPASSPFELLDGQRKAYAECRSVIKSILDRSISANRRKVVIVKGPPGSGKSVVAARLWANLVLNPELPGGNVVFTTTSMSQNSNWKYLFKKTAGETGAGGVVVKANEYIPCTTQDIGRWKKQFPELNFLVNDWKENLNTINALKKQPRMPDLHHLISIVDEAHALVNPENPLGRGQYGFAAAAGPQAYHIIRGSQISVFFTDPEQGFRQQETTSIDDIRRWSNELGADHIIEISLEDSQFRCGGSKEYVDWVDNTLSSKIDSMSYSDVNSFVIREPSNSFASTNKPFKHLDIKIVDNPIFLERILREKYEEGSTVRLLSSYARSWKTKGISNPHALQPSSKDFYEKVKINGNTKIWAKVWNLVLRGGDYSGFVQASPGSHMSENPLSEVGCPYAVRGFDFEYVGLLWLSDLKWRNGKWITDLDHVHETGLSKLKSNALKTTNLDSQEHQELLQYIKQAYRILLTRAIKGVYIWFEDKETEIAVRNSLDNI